MQKQLMQPKGNIYVAIIQQHRHTEIGEMTGTSYPIGLAEKAHNFSRFVNKLVLD